MHCILKCEKQSAQHSVFFLSQRAGAAQRLGVLGSADVKQRETALQLSVSKQNTSVTPKTKRNERTCSHRLKSSHNSQLHCRNQDNSNRLGFFLRAAQSPRPLGPSGAELYAWVKLKRHSRFEAVPVKTLALFPLSQTRVALASLSAKKHYKPPPLISSPLREETTQRQAAPTLLCPAQRRLRGQEENSWSGTRLGASSIQEAACTPVAECPGSYSTLYKLKLKNLGSYCVPRLTQRPKTWRGWSAAEGGGRGAEGSCKT